MEFLPDGSKRFPDDSSSASVKKGKMNEVLLPDEPLCLGNYFFGKQEIATNSGFIYKAKVPVEATYLIGSQRSGVTKVSFLLKICSFSRPLIIKKITRAISCRNG